MIRKTTKKTADAVGPEDSGLYREVTVELIQHYHENSKKLVKTEEGNRTEGKLFRLAKAGEKAATQLMDGRTFEVLSLVAAPESAYQSVLAAAEVVTSAPELEPQEEESVAEAEDSGSSEDEEMDSGEDNCEDVDDVATDVVPDGATDEATDETGDAVTDDGKSEDDMAAKKKKTTTAVAKTAAKKTAAVAKTAAKKTAAVAKTAAEKSDRAEATSGQSGPALKITKVNAKEAKVLEQLNHGSAPQRIVEIATCFKGKSKVTANSCVRNSLRRLVRGGLVKQVSRGTYGLTAKGKKFEAST